MHVHLHTPDLERAIAFYRAFLGTDPVKQKPGYAKFLPAWAPVNLALSEHSAAAHGSTVSHLGIQLTSPQAVQEQLARIRAAGLPVREEMGVTCCHANQDKFWVADPAGVEWEVYHLNFDVDEETNAVASSPACCAR
jgi:catechol 2,3-dioxygenase-like lactoylglutathione lyase family enzyme